MQGPGVSLAVCVIHIFMLRVVVTLSALNVSRCCTKQAGDTRSENTSRSQRRSAKTATFFIYCRFNHHHNCASGLEFNSKREMTKRWRFIINIICQHNSLFYFDFIFKCAILHCISAQGAPIKILYRWFSIVDIRLVSMIVHRTNNLTEMCYCSIIFSLTFPICANFFCQMCLTLYQREKTGFHVFKIVQTSFCYFRKLGTF